MIFFLKREREKGREREKSNVVFDLTFLFSTFNFFFFFFFNTVSQPEIEGLYRRFRALDKGHKGYISADEFLSIPELSINPLAKRLERVFESVNFKEFVGFLAAFSPRASREAKVRLIFAVFDADGDGVVSRSDLELCVRQLVGGSMGEEGVAAVVASALEGAAANKRKTAAGAGAESNGVEHTHEHTQERSTARAACCGNPLANHPGIGAVCSRRYRQRNRSVEVVDHRREPQ